MSTDMFVSRQYVPVFYVRSVLTFEVGLLGLKLLSYDPS